MISAFSRGGGVKNLPNLPTDSSKKLPTVKNRKEVADVLNVKLRQLFKFDTISKFK